MFRVSLILKNAREDKALNYAEISQKLKIPAKYLEALETEQIKNFPPDPYCSLIVKDYANFLGLNGNDVLSLFRRDFDRRSKNKTAKTNLVNFTPQFTFRLGFIVVVLVFAFYLVNEYIKYNQPPHLKVNWPEKNSLIELTGSTDNDATVRVNQDLIIVDSSGNFKKQLSLPSTETKITVESKSPSGKTTVVEKIYK
ncbi:MAG: helix-turn-helix domain-containing protein [Candidatus Shapirobacteria bacterium]|nr:helix-turn-helix domain-containing protein [Candidatus Shapirobacteria bacterium]